MTRIDEGFFFFKENVQPSNECLGGFTRRDLFDPNRHILLKQCGCLLFFFIIVIINERNGFAKNFFADAYTS